MITLTLGPNELAALKAALREYVTDKEVDPESLQQASSLLKRVKDLERISSRSGMRAVGPTPPSDKLKRKPEPEGDAALDGFKEKVRERLEAGIEKKQLCTRCGLVVASFLA